jgi:hypothetical protein
VVLDLLGVLGQVLSALLVAEVGPVGLDVRGVRDLGVDRHLLAAREVDDHVGTT